MRRTLSLTALLFALAASGGPGRDALRAASPITVEDRYGIPAETELQIALKQPLGVLINGVGDRIEAEVTRTVRSAEGRILLPAGSTVHGRVTDIARPATSGNQLAIGVAFSALEVGGRKFVLEADVQPEGGMPALINAISGYLNDIRPVGQLMAPTESLELTGITAGEAGKAVIGMGAGETDPVLRAGTRLTIALKRDLDLR